MLLQPIHNIAEICARKDVRNAILCPGSRSAALTIAMVRHAEIQTYSISDERSAGFIGLGMAQLTEKTVALVCTSGTAAYNFAPSVAEAFFQEIPLLILTADRPPEWIHQYDGQTIYQKDIFGKQVKKSFELPADYTHKDAVWQIERVLNEAINLTQTSPKGPVHINVPIREPFYPADNEEITFNKNVRIIENVIAEKKLSKEFWQRFREIWQESERKLIIVGHRQRSILNETLKKISEEFSIPVVGDIISNLNNQAGGVLQGIAADVFLSSKNEDLLYSLKPDLLITCGKSIISKNLKLFIRNNKPRFHFHIQENGELIDPFQTLSHKIDVSPEYFFNQLFEDLDFLKFKEGDEEEDELYFQKWQQANSKAKRHLNQFLTHIEFCEFKAIRIILETLPQNSIFHVANSMPVRYANLIGIQKNIEVFANRGTSGIDGSLSSAVGCALKTDKIVTCLIGDMSFFYDRNAFWNTYLPDNLRVIVLNNHGGNIFKIVDGPNKQPEVDEYFATKQNFTAYYTAIEAGLEYLKISTENELISSLSDFYSKNVKAKLIEIELDGDLNTRIFNEYKQLFAKFS